MIELQIDASEIDRAMRRLEKIPYAMQRAVIPAVSEMMRDVADQLADHLESEVPLPAKLSRKAVRVGSVSVRGNVVSGDIKVRSAHLPLIHYDVQPGDITARAGLPSRRWPGFTYALRAGERRQSRDLINGAGLPFIARMPGGHLGVYFRPGYNAGPRSGGRASGLWGKGSRGEKSHASIKELYGPDVQYHVADPAVEQAVIDRAADTFPVILSRYVEQAITAYGGDA
jgi:hypothetical protein